MFFNKTKSFWNAEIISYNATCSLGSPFGAVLQRGRLPREEDVKTGKHPEDLLRVFYRMSDVLAVVGGLQRLS